MYSICGDHFRLLQFYFKMLAGKICHMDIHPSAVTCLPVSVQDVMADRCIQDLRGGSFGCCGLRECGLHGCCSVLLMVHYVFWYLSIVATIDFFWWFVLHCLFYGIRHGWVLCAHESELLYSWWSILFTVSGHEGMTDLCIYTIQKSWAISHFFIIS